MSKNNFIKTSDENTANQLKLEGFTLVDKTNGIWTFINDRNATKFVFDNKKVVYSNKLCF